MHRREEGEKKEKYGQKSLYFIVTDISGIYPLLHEKLNEREREPNAEVKDDDVWT